jgi:hypothetical protein
LGYVTYQDIRSITSLQDQTVIAVKAPAETKLEVPESSGVSGPRFLMHTALSRVVGHSCCSHTVAQQQYKVLHFVCVGNNSEDKGEKKGLPKAIVALISES